MELDQSAAPSTAPSQSMSLPKALGIYAGCLGGALFVLTPLLSLFNRLMPAHPGLLVFAFVVLHLAIGVFLNRRVLRDLIEWHPFLATLDNVARAKIGMVVFWPVRYPVLFIKIAANKHL
jgi:hypothetical protein